MMSFQHVAKPHVPVVRLFHILDKTAYHISATKGRNSPKHLSASVAHAPLSADMPVGNHILMNVSGQ